MTIFTKILTSAKIGKIYGKRYDITERIKVLFDMSDIGHSRVLSKSQLFSFSAPSGCVFAVGCHTLLSFDIILLVYGSPHCCKEVWGRVARVKIQIYKFSFKKT